MAIFHNGKEITAVYYGKKAITAIYHGLRLVWQAVNSCFGAGYWDDSKPWSDSDGWRDN